MAASSDKSKMPSKDSQRLQRHYEYFLESVFNPDGLIDYLFAKNVLNLDTHTRILDSERGQPRVKQLLYILMTECGDCYQIFLQALREKGFGKIADELDEQTSTDVRVALIGKTGVGKSHLGNLLLRREFFKCSSSLKSKTSDCSTGKRCLDLENHLTVIDTPGIFDTRDPNTETVQNFLSIFRQVTGVHVFLMVVRVDVRFTEEEEETLQFLCDVFGEEIYKHLIVIMNNHSPNTKSKDDLVGEIPEILNRILCRCEERWLIVNQITCVTDDDNPEIVAIINTIQNTVLENRGHFYTHATFGKAEKVYNEKLNQCKKSSVQNNISFPRYLLQKNTIRPKSKYQTVAENFLEDASCKHFVKTRAYEEGNRLLEKHYILGVIGAVGDGKTALCRMVANSFLANHKDFIPIDIRDPGDMDAITFTDQDNYLVIIDDMFGMWTRTIKHQIEEWPKHFELFYLAKENRKAAIVYIMRNDVNQACQHVLKKYEIFSTVYQLNLHEMPFQLSRDEKLDILRYYFGHTCDKKLEEMVKNSSESFGFPYVVSLCRKTSKGKAFRMLKILFEFLLGEYDIFWKEDRNKYIALLIVFGPQAIAEDDIRQKIKHLRNQIQDMGNATPVEDVLDSCNDLTGSYIVRDFNNRMFLPEKVIRSFLLHASERFLKLVIEYCPFDLLIDLVSTVPGDQKVFIRSRFYETLYLRFSRELKENNEAVLFHQAFLDYSFLQEFLHLDSANLLFNPGLKMALGGLNDEGHFLHYLCLYGYLKELQIVLSHPNELPPKLSGTNTKHGLDLLCIAIKSEKDTLDKINYLRNQAYVMEHRRKGDAYQLILAAVQSNSCHTLKHIMSFTDIDISNSDLLHRACESEYDIPEIIEYLAGQGMDINGLDADGCTPLRLAAKRGKILTIRCLLKNPNISASMVDKDGRLPIHVAADSNTGRLDIDTSGIIEELVNAGSPVTTKDACGRTPLMNALANCDEKTVGVLLRKGGDDDVVTTSEDYSNKFPLHHSAFIDDIHKFTSVLDQYKDSIHTVDSNGKTPIERVCFSKIDIMRKVKLLVSRGYTSSETLSDICQSAPTDLFKLIFSNTICYGRMDEFDQTGILEIRKCLFKESLSKQNLLHYACRYSTLVVVQYLIDNKCNVNCVRGEYNRTPLFYCCYKDVPQAVEKIKALVSNGAKLDVTDEGNLSLLHLACWKSTAHVVQHLIDNNCNLNCVGGKYNRTPIFYCCERGVTQAVEKVEIMVSNGSVLQHAGKDRSQLLHIACAASTVHVVQYLIDNNCNVNCVGGKHNRTPLFYCCFKDVPEAVEKMEVLVRNGAILDVSDIDNESLLHLACRRTTEHIVQYLIDNNCNVNCVGGKYNRTPIFYCCYKDVSQAVEKMKILVSNGAILDVAVKDNQPLLHIACWRSNLAAVQYLIYNNCNVNSVGGKYNRTPLFYCSEKDVVQAVEKMEILVSNGAKLDVIDAQSLTLLDYAKRSSAVEVVKYLEDRNVQYKADI